MWLKSHRKLKYKILFQEEEQHLFQEEHTDNRNPCINGTAISPMAAIIAFNVNSHGAFFILCSFRYEKIFFKKVVQ